MTRSLGFLTAGAENEGVSKVVVSVDGECGHNG
jgi:hypothetical protein